MVDVSAVDSGYPVLYDGLDRLEKEELAYRRKFEVLALRAIVMVEVGGRREILYQQINTSAQYTRWVRTYFPLAIGVGACLALNLIMPLILAVAFIARGVIEGVLGKPNYFSRGQVENLSYQMINQFRAEGLTADKVLNCVFEMDLGDPWQAPPLGEEKTFFICKFGQKDIQQVFEAPSRST